MRQIIHIDMDAFFASVEQRDNPALRGKPVIIGGNPHSRGVVSTCSYEARAYGVRSAMPLRQAYSLCPHGIFLSGSIRKYTQASEQVMDILSGYTPLVEPVSIDEAFMDVTACRNLFGDAEKIAREIVARIEQEVGLTASVGVAPNKFLAKLASDLRKPKGFVVVRPDEIDSLLAGLPVKRLWGVGPKTEQALLSLGISTVGVLRDVPLDLLTQNFGREMGEHLFRLSRGIDERPVVTGEDMKSVSHETTFAEDTDDREFLAGVLLELADLVARRMRRNGVQGRTVTLKLRDTNFNTITRSRSLPQPTDFEEVIYRCALEMAVEAEWGKKKVRLLGVGMSNLTQGDREQLSLFESGERDKLKRLHRAVDGIKDKMGDGSVTRGGIAGLKKSPRPPGWRGRGESENARPSAKSEKSFEPMP